MVNIGPQNFYVRNNKKKYHIVFMKNISTNQIILCVLLILINKFITRNKSISMNLFQIVNEYTDSKKQEKIEPL